jgi:hypothetical protein
MAQTLNIGDFFRRSPREWLRRYFESKGVLASIDWPSIRARNVAPLMDAWLALDADLRGQMVEDFRAISLMTTAAGVAAIWRRHGRKELELARRVGQTSESAAVHLSPRGKFASRSRTGPTA